MQEVVGNTDDWRVGNRLYAKENNATSPVCQDLPGGMYFSTMCWINGAAFSERK